ncbi:hypothetical protein B0H11DRAFT_1937372 [Mycena galericulata]|nr:hypothetical protein B0H11DRAFT_1937372 [Mycena galericulata]
MVDSFWVNQIYIDGDTASQFMPIRKLAVSTACSSTFGLKDFLAVVVVLELGFIDITHIAFFIGGVRTATPAAVPSSIAVVIDFGRCGDGHFHMREVEAKFELASQGIKMGDQEQVGSGQGFRPKVRTRLMPQSLAALLQIIGV